MAFRAILRSQVLGAARFGSYRSKARKAFMNTWEVTSSAASRVASRNRTYRYTVGWWSRNHCEKSGGNPVSAWTSAFLPEDCVTWSRVSITPLYGCPGWGLHSHRQLEAASYRRSPTYLARSTTRQEYPHSLSYQESTFTMFPPITAVLRASTMELAGCPV